MCLRTCEMKRVQEEQVLVEKEFSELPFELQGRILAESFQRRIKNPSEMNRFVLLRTISRSVDEMTERYTFALVRKIKQSVLDLIKPSYLLLFRELVSMKCYFPPQISLEHFKKLESFKLDVVRHYHGPYPISGMTQLKKLALPVVRNSDLEGLTNLTNLKLSMNSPVSETILTSLVNLTKLTLLQPAQKCFRITRDCIEKLPMLTSLCITSGSFLDHGSLFSTKLRELECYNCSGNLLDIHLYPLIHLRVLRLRSSTVISDSALTRFVQLETLSLYGEHRITFDGINQLAKLSTLFLSFVQIGNGQNQLLSITKLTNLSSLTLCTCPYKVMTKLALPSNIVNLKLEDNVSLDGNFFTNLVNLRHLSLLKQDLSFSALRVCTNLKSIKESKGRRYWLDGGWNRRV